MVLAMVCVPPCHGGACGFESRLDRKKHDFVAQQVEQLTLNQRVEGSSPSGVTKNFEFSFLSCNSYLSY